MQEIVSPQPDTITKTPKKQSWWWLLIGGLIIVAALLVIILRPTDSNDQPTEVAGTVSIKNDNFTPATIAVKKGQAITWTNQDSKAHSLKSDALPGLSTSQPMRSGESYTYNFEASGTYQYYDPANTDLKGTVIVE